MKHIRINETELKTEESYNFIFSLSIYDHCLTEEEAEEKILSYAILTDANKQKYFQEEEKLLNFYKKIFENYKFTITFRNDQTKVCDVESFNELLEICTNSVREKKFINIYIKEIDTIISGSFDLEILLFVNDIRIIDQMKAQNLFKDLYLLPTRHSSVQESLVDPDTGQIICPTRGIHHGGSYWKLFENQEDLYMGKRIGTISEDGRFLRK